MRNRLEKKSAKIYRPYDTALQEYAMVTNNF